MEEGTHLTGMRGLRTNAQEGVGRQLLSKGVDLLGCKERQSFHFLGKGTGGVTGRSPRREEKKLTANGMGRDPFRKTERREKKYQPF